MNAVVALRVSRRDWWNIITVAGPTAHAAGYNSAVSQESPWRTYFPGQRGRRGHIRSLAGGTPAVPGADLSDRNVAGERRL